MASSVALPRGTRPQLNVQVPSHETQSPINEKFDPSRLDPDAAVSPIESREREAANRLNDDLELLRVERIVSHQDHEAGRPRSRNRSHADQHVEDAFNTETPTAPNHTTPQKTTWLTEFWAWLRRFPRVLRYILYAVPAAAIILIPVFLDLFAYDRNTEPVGGDGGVDLLWFGIWLEVVWLAFWAARVITSIMPAVFGFIADTVGSSNHKKWNDIGRQLEFATALFIWMLAILVSYNPILNGHRESVDGDDEMPDVPWIDVVYKIVIALFTLTALNFVEKILIQWIATSFHLRTYSHRIRDNQMEIGFLVDLYSHAKTRLDDQDITWDSSVTAAGSPGTRTPMKAIHNKGRNAWSKVGVAANRVAGDFTGRKIPRSTQSRRVVLELLRSTHASYTLARVFYRSFANPGQSTLTLGDLEPAFATREEAETCFGVFDKDLNGDISMEELEMVCNEIHLEKKAIAASLRDLDSVIRKLDEVFMFIIALIVIVVFISIISNSAAAALTSAGTVVLGLSWLLQATAQEFLQSIIFVFVKHPFDVGDRVTVYGNTGDTMQGDDYYVVEVSLLYTEFRKMQGHVVQAPNSLLNTLFILNQRRSQGLADPISLKLRFGTTEDQIEELKARMLEFCVQNKRDYAPRIISEVRTIDEVYSISMNLIFFHKSNYQNELLRLTRHNKFAVELMRNMHEMGLEGPRVVQPGGMRNMPVYWSQVHPPPAYHQPGASSVASPPPVSSPTRQRNSRAAVVEAGMDFQDVYRNRRQESHLARMPSIIQTPEERSDSNVSGLDERLERLEKTETQGNESVRSPPGRPRAWTTRGRRSNTGGSAIGSNAV